jgi:putative oxidoreductase
MVGGGAAGIHGDLTMTPLDSSRRNGVALAISLVLTAVFIYAGIDKMRNPLDFADSIAAFAILPAACINLMAMGLPPFEIGCGLLLIGPATRRVGALAVAVISSIFFMALASALIRGLTLDCGCFGVGAPSRPRMWLELGLDAVLVAGAVFVYLQSLGRMWARAANTPAIN